MTMNIAVTGAGGQLGRDVCRVLSKTHNLVSFNRKELDIADENRLRAIIEANQFDYLVNCAAFTDLDKAQVDPDYAFRINSRGPALLANLCKLHNIKLIHISTDAVFSSETERFFNVCDEHNPLNVYGLSKSSGEQLLTVEQPDSWIIRTSWLYGEYGGKFAHAIIRKALGDAKSFEVVNDQYGQPTLTSSLANYISEIIQDLPPYGIYHFASTDYVSRYDFAKALFKRLGGNSSLIVPVSTQVDNSIAPRPKFSLLGDISVSNHWESGLDQFVEMYGEKS